MVEYMGLYILTYNRACIFLDVDLSEQPTFVVLVHD